MPKQLIAAGRDADIYEAGPGLVLRRSRNGYSMANEARAMEYARSHGYPVPAVEEVSDDGTELVMERVDGPSMLVPLSRQPWALKHYARMLADLHNRLHEIEGPEWLTPAPGGNGERLVHLDLHPLNVILSPKGPVVIDWANVARGDPAADVALTWVLLATAGVPAGRLQAALLGRLRSVFVSAFVRELDRGPVREQLRAVIEWKLDDPNMTDAERRAMRRLCADNSAGP